LTYLLVFNIRSFPVILILFTLSGTPTVAGQVSNQTLLQTNVEDRFRGRVFSAYVATLSLLLLIGTGLGSVLAAPLGVVLVLDVGCSLFLLAGIAALFLVKTSVVVSQHLSSPPVAARLFMLWQAFAAYGSKSLPQQKPLQTAEGSEESRRNET